MHIIDGTDVGGGGDVNWTGTILIGDGTTWYTRLTKANVVDITHSFIAAPASTYEFDTVTKIRFNLTDGTNFNLELQKVANQPTWNTGTQAAINTAIGDLNTILSS